MSTATFQETRPLVDSRVLRVLIVEDDAGGRWALSALLRRLGHECETARDGEEALEMVASFEPDIVLTDLMMPGMDGLEFTRRMKGNPHTHDIPVFLLTADATGVGAAAAVEGGCDGYLAKPIVLSELLSRIRACLANSGMKGKLARDRQDGL